MSLESLNMAGGVLGTAFSLLLLASITQGLQQDVDILHYEKMEAVVGENVTLPCIIQSSPSLTIVSVEWRKNKSGNTKLAVYSPNLGLWKFWPNVTMQNVPNGSYLHLHHVETWDSGFYICEIATFPLGAIRSETELKIKDEVKLLCDAESIVEVPSGENVTISCTAFPADHYKWTKNNTLVSESESLELWLVTEAHSGIYTLTVITGNKSVHKRFSITVLTATTSLRTDLMTAPPQSNVTEEGLITSPTTRRPNIDGNVTWTMNMSTDITDDPNSRNVTDGAHMTHLTDYTHISVTSSPVTHTDSYHFNSSTDQEINSTHNPNTSTFSDQSVASNPTTTLSNGNKVFRSTQETKNESMGGNPVATPTPNTGNTTVVIEDGGWIYRLRSNHLLRRSSIQLQDVMIFTQGPCSLQGVTL
ncbi:nectin-3 isoform X1 [Pseudochaenichthys georgianus]|uniref:nectin-3 isoform X1 n=1 Tax=Pseudochaenichthys georgianus TaxID=52239 RepID=UPI00146DFA05|nr:nectin-3 isoform X1 [Pseudochaenichthys georgianus]